MPGLGLAHVQTNTIIYQDHQDDEQTPMQPPAASLPKGHTALQSFLVLSSSDRPGTLNSSKSGPRAGNNELRRSNEQAMQDGNNDAEAEDTPLDTAAKAALKYDDNV